MRSCWIGFPSGMPMSSEDLAARPITSRTLCRYTLRTSLAIFTYSDAGNPKVFVEVDEIANQSP